MGVGGTDGAGDDAAINGTAINGTAANGLPQPPQKRAREPHLWPHCEQKRGASVRVASVRVASDGELLLLMCL